MTEVTINNKLLRLQAVESVPEISLHLCDTAHVLVPGQRYECWPYAWVGGRSLARYILDNPQLVAGKTVVDLASGSGIVAIAAKLAGAARVVAVDDYIYSIQAIQLNATANGVDIETVQQNVFDFTPSYGDLFVAGDPFYHEDLFSYLKNNFSPMLMGCPLRGDTWYHFFMTPEKIVETYTMQVPEGYDDATEYQSHVWWLNE